MNAINRRLTAVLSAACLIFSGLYAAPPEEDEIHLTLETKLLSGKGNVLIKGEKVKQGTFFDDEAVNNLLNGEGIDLLSAPKITTLPGKKAVMSIQEHLIYLELREDNTLIPKDVPEDQLPGVRLETVMTPMEVLVPSQKGTVKLESNLRVNTLESRQPIPGIPLDAGLPIIHTRQLNTSMVVPFGKWVVAGGQQFRDEARGDTEHLIILMRVTAAEKMAEEKEKSR